MVPNNNNKKPLIEKAGTQHRPETINVQTIGSLLIVQLRSVKEKAGFLIFIPFNPDTDA